MGALLRSRYLKHSYFISHQRVSLLQFQWHEPLGVIICSLASTGLAACAVIFILYVMNNNHPLVKSASREVSYFLLASLSLCYCFCFCFIIQPSGWVCIARQTGVCLCFTLIYGPLVTKTSRIYRQEGYYSFKFPGGEGAHITAQNYIF